MSIDAQKWLRLAEAEGGESAQIMDKSGKRDSQNTQSNK